MLKHNQELGEFNNRRKSNRLTFPKLFENRHVSRSYWCGFVAASVFLRILELEQGGGLFFKLGIELERITTMFLEGEVGSFSSWDPSPQMIHIESPIKNINQKHYLSLTLSLHCPARRRAREKQGCKEQRAKSIRMH